MTININNINNLKEIITIIKNKTRLDFQNKTNSGIQQIFSTFNFHFPKAWIVWLFIEVFYVKISRLVIL